jgi:hypothetical protein
MMHRPIPEQARYLAAVVRGHTRYYGVPFNSGAITRFRFAVVHIWHWFLRRRSQRNRMTWERMSRLASRWIPCRPCLPTLSVQTAPRPIPEVGAQCGSPARWDLCGGPWATRVPTATRSRAGSEQRLRRPIDVANPRRIGRFACGSRRQWDAESATLSLTGLLHRPVRIAGTVRRHPRDSLSSRPTSISRRSSWRRSTSSNRSYSPACP